jgi:Glycosyl transferase family 2
MKLVMTLLVRNEEDIVAANIGYHLSRGVDFVIATDNLSTDNTAEILRGYERTGRLRYLFEPTDDYSQDLWVSRMAHLAAAEHNADWVMHVDADEFWWPETGDSLKEPLQRVNVALDGIVVQRSNFVRVPDAGGGPFHRVMQYRERHSKNALGETLPGKIAHRARQSVSVRQGNHGFTIDGQPARVADCTEFLIFHFPLRSSRQFRTKIAHGGAAYARNTRLDPGVGQTWRQLYELELAGTLGAYVEKQAVSAVALSRRIQAGDLVHDDRLDRYLEDFVTPRVAPDTLLAPDPATLLGTNE